MPKQTPAQLAAAENAAGLSSAQKAGVASGKGYTPSNPSLSYYTPTPPAASLPAASSGNNAATTAPVLPSASNPSQTPEISPQAPQPVQTPKTHIAPPSGSVGANPTLPSLDTVRAAMGTLSTTPAQMETGSLQYQDKAVQASQDIIDAIERSYNSAISTAGGNAAASAAASGMAGSVQAGSEVASAMQPILEARAKTVADAITNIRSTAASQYQAFQSQGVANAQNVLSQFKDAQTQVVGAATSVWAAGYTPEELKTSNPDEYQYLLEYAYNGDTNAMNAAYIAAGRANLLNNGQPVYQSGGQMTFAQFSGLNPDGTPNFKFTSFTDANIPQGYKMQSSNQTSLGQVINTYAPIDSNGNVTDPAQVITTLNGSIISGPGAKPGSIGTNPALTGQTIGSTTLGIVPNGVSETNALSAQAVLDGSAPPPASSTGNVASSANIQQMKSYLSANGYDLTTAALDWAAVSKYVSTLNSATQVRFRQAVQSIPNMLPNAQTLFDKLQTDMQGTTTLPQGLTVLNSANLAAFASGAYGEQLQSDAINLQQQITDITTELGVVYKGGNSATDQALQTGATQLSGSWDPVTFKNAISLIEQNMQYRKNSVLNAGVAGVSGDNIYGSHVSGGTASADSGDVTFTPSTPVDVSNATW